MSFQALGAALSGLRVAQQQLSTISNNVANATTPGYTRKILPQTSQVINSTGQTVGVQSETMIRRVDLNLERELWTQVSSVGETSTRASYLDRIEKFHGITNKETSISAQIAKLKDTFAALSDSPSDGFLLQNTLSQAKTVADKFNQFGGLITQMRNDTQDDMTTAVGRMNDLLGQISKLNQDIKGAVNVNRTTAPLEDKRDEAIKQLAEYVDLTMFTRGDGVMVLQTRTGVQLCDENPTPIFFGANELGPENTYPASAAGIYVGGDPQFNRQAFDIASTQLGGKLGALIDLRDNTLVQYQAQTDELAHKLALRLESQGLRLFTDASGTVPDDTPPDPGANPPVAVSYVGFASTIRVNPSVVNDVTQIQRGTFESDAPIPSGSNETIRRVIQFGFGNVNYQEAAGTTNLNLTAPTTDLQSWLGLHSTNNVVGGLDFSAFAQIDDGLPGTTDLAGTLQQYFPAWPNGDQFQVTFTEPRLGLGPTTITVDLSAASVNQPLGPGVTNALDQIIAEINDQITAAGVPAGLAANATKNSNGQLVIESRGNVVLDASSFAGSMGKTAFTALGLKEATYKTEDPYFDIQVGSGPLHRIRLEPGETVTDLIDKIEYDKVTGTGVPGLYVGFDSATGRLTLRPGGDDSNGGPDYGGDFKIIAGPGKSSGATNPALAALPQGVGIATALFGSYSVSGGTVKESSPVRNVEYGSETAAGSNVFVPFRRTGLGAAASVTMSITAGQNIVDFGQKMINAQAQDIILTNQKVGDSETLRDLLGERLTSESGVNIDEELSTLIVVQTAYAAAARAVTAVSDMFDELLNAMR